MAQRRTWSATRSLAHRDGAPCTPVVQGRHASIGSALPDEFRPSLHKKPGATFPLKLATQPAMPVCAVSNLLHW